MFTKESLERFRNPKNIGQLEKHNGFGTAGDIKCSDVIELYILFNNDRIENAKFKVFGCPGAVSTTDSFIDMIKGKTIEEVTNISENEISDSLGGLPLGHMHCASLPLEAFKIAVKNYIESKKNG